MVDLNKLNGAIDVLDVSTKKINGISNMIVSIDNTAKTVETCVTAIDNVNKSNLVMQDSVKETLDVLESNFAELNKQHAKFISDTETLLFEFKSEGHKLNKQLESAFEAKIELMKSDLVLENRNIISKLQENNNEKILNTQNIIVNNLSDVQNAIVDKTETLFSVHSKEIAGRHDIILSNLSDVQNAVVSKIEGLVLSQNEVSKKRFDFVKKMFIGLSSALLIIIILLMIIIIGCVR